MEDNVITDCQTGCLLYSGAARSDIGGREQQQDFAYLQISVDHVYAAVCDGIGGAADGGVASKEAILSLRRSYAEYPPTQGKDVTAFLYQAMINADRAVYNKTHGLGGTTLVAVYISDMKLYWISAGDSRLYILRGNEIIQATRDHNYKLKINELLKAGKLTHDDYEKELEQGEALLSYLGKGNIDLYDLTQNPFILQHGDVIFATTDGVYRAISISRIYSTLSADVSIVQRADSIIHIIQDKGQKELQDNSTFVLIDIL